MTALGVSLLVIGAVVIVVEAHLPTMGMLGGPGVVALGVGAVLAVGGLGGGLALGLVTALLLVIAGVGGLALSLRKGIAVRGRRISVGPESLIGHMGTVQSWGEPAGKVLVDGALWRARRSWGDDEHSELHEGDPIVVERRTGLTLAVRRAEDWELAP
jgi:membrane-bound ClpP family serine protease